MKYQRRSGEVDAERWFPGGIPVRGVYETPASFMPAGVAECVRDGLSDTIRECGAVQIDNGWALVTPGDWVVRGEGGGLSVYKPAEFDAAFESVPLRIASEDAGGPNGDDGRDRGNPFCAANEQP